MNNTQATLCRISSRVVIVAILTPSGTNIEENPIKQLLFIKTSLKNQSRYDRFTLSSAR